MGNTHAEIATEKAGVLKNGASFIYATDRTDVRDVFKQKANEEGSKTYELGKDFTAEGSSHSFDFIYKEQRLEGIALAMLVNIRWQMLVWLSWLVFCFKRIILK